MHVSFVQPNTPWFPPVEPHSHQQPDPQAAQTARFAAHEPAPKFDWEPSVASRKWQEIVLHHSAAAEGSVEAIDRVHRERTDSQGRKWLGIGYHFVIGNGHGMADGAIEPTFRWHKQLAGAHAGDVTHNAVGVGICLVGDCNQSPPSERQLAAARRLIDGLRARYDLPAASILVHRELKPTECPGRMFPYQQLLGRQPVERNPGDPRNGTDP
jgi:N-acetyl-anhydromuramyl-L-alanine amidase AmpD